YGHVDRDRRRGAADFHVLPLQDLQQQRARARALAIGREDVGGWAGQLRLLDRALALQVEILQEQRGVVGKVIERGEQAALFVVVVVALRPHHLRQRRVRLVPRTLVLIGIEDALERVRTVVAEGLVQPADA